MPVIPKGYIITDKCCDKTRFYDTLADFPTTGLPSRLYIDRETFTVYMWDTITEAYIPTSVPASITGFDTMAAATLSLGLGRFFYYNEANLDGATAGSLHITI